VALEGGYFGARAGRRPDPHRAGAALLAAMHNGELDITGGGGPTMVVGTFKGWRR